MRARSEQLYRPFVEQMNQGALLLSRDGVILYANRRFSEIVEAAEPEVTGASLTGFTAPESLEALEEVLAQARAGQGQGEAVLRRSSGGGVPVHLSASRDGDNAGTLRCMVTDLTERKRLERSRQAEGQSREEGPDENEFLGTLAHALRNPLTPILYALHILKNPDTEEALAEEAREVIGRQVDQMSRLIEDLLELSRLARGKIRLEREVVRLDRAVGKAVDAAMPELRERRHDLAVSLPPEPILLEADPARLARILGILLDNAARFTPDGGRIRLAAERRGGEVVLRVRDSGIGIEPDLLPHVFDDISARAGHAAPRSRSGLGIGLSLVRQLAELHGGRVEAESEGKDRGSEFVVRLPACPAPPP
jgi:PAS domain S-box-containing protein